MREILHAISDYPIEFIVLSIVVIWFFEKLKNKKDKND